MKQSRRQFLYVVELSKYMPDDIYRWDDASNNRFFVSGRGSAIQNASSAWRWAARDALEIASDTWHHDVPAGPKGAYRGVLSFTWGLWQDGKEKTAIKELLTHLLEREQQYKLLDAAEGYDLPQILAFYDHPVYEELGPPKGSLYNYPVRGDETLMIGGYPSPRGWPCRSTAGRSSPPWPPRPVPASWA